MKTEELRKSITRNFSFVVGISIGLVKPAPLNSPISKLVGLESRGEVDSFWMLKEATYRSVREKDCSFLLFWTNRFIIKFGEANKDWSYQLKFLLLMIQLQKLLFKLKKIFNQKIIRLVVFKLFSLNLLTIYQSKTIMQIYDLPSIV